MLYSQPLATRFGTDLTNDLNSGVWHSLRIAVAWVRASGMAHLRPSLESFIKAGGRLQIIVGIDLDNTTKEGLESLLALTGVGKVDLFVYHNEAGGIFHPKLYLFSNAAKAKLIVGSNNLTQAGLFQNTEAGLSVVLPLADPIIAEARNTLSSWSDLTSGMAKVLDGGFLAELLANGYVRDEATARAEIANRKKSAAASATTSKKLFSGLAVSAPAAPASGSKPAGGSVSKTSGSVRKSAGVSAVGASASGSVLLMRVRRSRGTQVQLPIVVAGTYF
ncbi:MAG TPA: phospholipase D family protein, partial [Burkholderiales bacterium]|nr:phospholipase D family protein [Burkholderiales bacterium]